MIEVVIYVALLVVLLVAITGTLLAISKTSRELSAWQSLQNEGSSIMDRLTREVRAADAVASGGVFGANPGRLVLSTEGLSGSVVADTKIGVDGTDLYLKVGSAATTTLTNNTEVASLIFRQITNGSVEAVRVELVLTTASSNKTLDLYNTIILRSSYGQ